MAILLPKRMTSRSFLWVPETRQFVAEASDLGDLGQVYDDACDLGLTLVSSRYPDRAPVVFVIDRTERDGEGDVVAWVLVPADRKPRGFTIKIFND